MVTKAYYYTDGYITINIYQKAASALGRNFLTNYEVC